LSERAGCARLTSTAEAASPNAIIDKARNFSITIFVSFGRSAAPPMESGSRPTQEPCLKRIDQRKPLKNWNYCAGLAIRTNAVGAVECRVSATPSAGRCAMSSRGKRFGCRRRATWRTPEAKLRAPETPSVVDLELDDFGVAVAR
jgi:hypothetical protein